MPIHLTYLQRLRLVARVATYLHTHQHDPFCHLGLVMALIQTVARTA